MARVIIKVCPRYVGGLWGGAVRVSQVWPEGRAEVHGKTMQVGEEEGRLGQKE